MCVCVCQVSLFLNFCLILLTHEIKNICKKKLQNNCTSLSHDTILVQIDTRRDIYNNNYLWVVAEAKVWKLKSLLEK